MKTTIQVAGGRSPVAYAIESGAAKVVVRTQDGRAAIIGLRRAGALLNAPAVLANTPAFASIVTVTASRLIAVPRSAFVEHTQSVPAFGKMVYEAISSDTDEVYAALGAVMVEAASDRLWHLLTQLSAPANGETDRFSRVCPWLTRDEMAESIGCTRVYLSKLLARFEGDGLLQRRQGWIFISTDTRAANGSGRLLHCLESSK